MQTSSATNTPVPPSPDVPLDIFFSEEEYAHIYALAAQTGATTESYIRSATAGLVAPEPAVCSECEFPLLPYLHLSCEASRVPAEEAFAE